MLRKSMILQLFYGLKGHYEQVKLSEEYKKCIDDVIKQDDNMLKLLKNAPELCKQYRMATEALDVLNSASDDMHYSEGFKIGLLLGLEVGEFFCTEKE